MFMMVFILEPLAPGEPENFLPPVCRGAPLTLDDFKVGK